MKKVKIITSSDQIELETSVNTFLSDNDALITLIDIKYVSDTGLKQAFIIYTLL